MTEPAPHRPERPRRGLSRLRRRELWVPSVALLAMGIWLAPARGTTLRGDDAGFHLRGLLDITGESFASVVGDAFVDALERFRPQLLAGIHSNSVLYVFQGHTTAYKLFLVALTLLCAALFWALLRRLGASLPVAVIALAIVAASIQFRAYHDPVLGYFGTTQVALACVLGSLLVFMDALRTGSRRHHAGAAALFAAACLLHEYAYPVAAAHLVLALSVRRGRRALRAAAPALAVGAAFSLVGFVGRMGVAPQEAFLGYELTSSPGGTIRSFFVQLLPPLPGSARIFEQGNVFYPAGVQPTRAELLAASWRALAIAAAVAITAFHISRDGIASLPGVPWLARTAALGAVLWATPVVLLAVSPKYQLELTPGKGYLAVLFQSFGVALCGTAGLIGLLRLAAGRSRLALRSTIAAAAVLLGYSAGVTGFNNMRIAALDNVFRESRELIETGAARGALAALADGTTLLFSEKDTTWPTGDWRLGRHTLEAVLRTQTGKLFDGRVNVEQTGFDCPRRRDRPVPADCEPFGPRTAWVRARPRPGGGSMFASPLQGATTENFRGLPVTTTIRAYNSAPQPPTLVATTASGQPWTSAGRPWRRIGGGDGWGLFELDVGPDGPVAATLDDALAKVNLAALPGPEDRVRIYGASGLLP